MKRFWCRKCKRIVRTRSLPRGVDETGEGGPKGIARIGVCRNHPSPIPGRASGYTSRVYGRPR